MSFVTSLQGYKKLDNPREQRLKRLAIQLAAQLPEDIGEALDALEYAKTLVRSFMGDPKPV